MLTFSPARSRIGTASARDSDSTLGTVTAPVGGVVTVVVDEVAVVPAPVVGAALVVVGAGATVVVGAATLPWLRLLSASAIAATTSAADRDREHEPASLERPGRGVPSQERERRRGAGNQTDEGTRGELHRLDSVGVWPRRRTACPIRVVCHRAGD